VLRTERRDEILRMLRDRHVDARVHYPRTLATANAFRAFCRPGTYPHAEQATRQLVSLPCSPELRDDELDRLLQAVDEVFRGL
jgi:dTDP-4-amino-4,6-dideoxygalactose transaminase